MILVSVVIDHETGKVTKMLSSMGESPMERQYAEMVKKLIDAAFDPQAQAALAKIVKVKKPAKKARGGKK